MKNNNDEALKSTNLNEESIKKPTSAKQKLVQSFLKIFNILRWLSPIILCILTFYGAYKRKSALEGWEIGSLITKSLTLFIAFSFGSWSLKKIMIFRIKNGLEK